MHERVSGVLDMFLVLLSQNDSSVACMSYYIRYGGAVTNQQKCCKPTSSG